MERRFDVQAVDELNASWEAIAKLPESQQKRVRKVNVQWDGDETGWFDSDTANGAIDCSSLSTDDAKLLCSELAERLEAIVDAIWNGDLEQLGAEHFTDPARALIAQIKGE